MRVNTTALTAASRKLRHKTTNSSASNPIRSDPCQPNRAVGRAKRRTQVARRFGLRYLMPNSLNRINAMEHFWEVKFRYLLGI